jgi:hypothetical protein
MRKEDQEKLRLIDERFRGLAAEWSDVSFGESTRAFQPRPTADELTFPESPLDAFTLGRARELLPSLLTEGAPGPSFDLLTYREQLRLVLRHARDWRVALAPACTLALTFGTIFSLVNAPVYEASWVESFNVEGSVSTGTWDESPIKSSGGGTCFPTTETAPEEAVPSDPAPPSEGDNESAEPPTTDLVPEASATSEPTSTNTVAPTATETEAPTATETPAPTETPEPTATDPAPEETTTTLDPVADAITTETPDGSAEPTETDVADPAVTEVTDEPTATPENTVTPISEGNVEPGPAALTPLAAGLSQGSAGPETSRSSSETTIAAPPASEAQITARTIAPAAIVDAAVPRTVPSQPVFCSTEEGPQ